MSRKQAARPALRQGLGQLTLVEHALCPLDPALSLQKNLVHEAEYCFSDRRGRRQTSRARVCCPLGLSAHDEFYLWGLLALTLAQGDASDDELHATPDYCLKRLGLIDGQGRRGGRQYRQFAAALERLSAVQYLNPRFYDPVRAEHRRVSFGFFSYTLPLDERSSRAWRICWDRLFLEMVRASGGAMRFDLSLYRRLDPAARRLFLFVSKVFFRRRQPLRLDVRHLGVNVLGFSPDLIARDLKAKVRRCAGALADAGVLDGQPARFEKTQPGRYSVELRPGDYFVRTQSQSVAGSVDDSPLAEGLRSLGVSEPAIAYLQRRHPQGLLREWLDITLAAQERFGRSFFKQSAAAYFVDNVQAAAAGTRTPPDWWHDVRKAEERAQAERHRQRAAAERTEPLPDGPSREAFDHIRDDIFGQLLAAGQSREAARRNAERFTWEHLRRRQAPQTVSGTSLVKFHR